MTGTAMDFDLRNIPAASGAPVGGYDATPGAVYKLIFGISSSGLDDPVTVTVAEDGLSATCDRLVTAVVDNGKIIGFNRVDG